MFRVTTYMRDGKGWMLDKKYLYDDRQKFTKQVKHHKEKKVKPLNVPGMEKWVTNLLNTNLKKSWPKNWRVLSEEFVNGQWVTIEDWIMP